MKTFKNCCLIGGFVLLLLLGAYYFFYQPKKVSVKLGSLEAYQVDAAYQASFQERDLSFAQKAFSLQEATGLIRIHFTDTPQETMGKKAIYPMTLLAAGLSNKWSANNREENKDRIIKLWKAYGTIIREASLVHRIPNHLLLAVIAVEHDDSVNVIQSAAQRDGIYIGLAQIALRTAKDSVLRYPKNGWITKSQLKPFQEKGLIKNNLIILTSADLYKPDVNIHAAAATLSGLAFKFGFLNTFRWIFAYNRGEGRMITDRTQELNMDDLIKHYRKVKAHAIGADYICNILGPHGAADIIFNELSIQD